ncbi:MAG: 4-(cytidine 5'-diphospho)-2-C-methyl-D-erythritol kinase [Clostridia bacterium]|nr:4-(cytidine 5'-diphospho)-2-C-methyl-D-erythritol kinase [Clostridia bacterium]
MVLQARAKINWALDIPGTREDGFHQVDMLMQSIELSDTLCMEADEEMILTGDGIPVPLGEDNLILRAARALNDLTGTQHGARIHVTKRIPLCAGLGGGSSDCAAALNGLNRLWDLGLSENDLLYAANRLGSDIAFCLRGGFARAGGRGEDLAFLDGAPEIHLALIHPGTGLSTGQVYGRWDECGDRGARSDIPALVAALREGRLEEAEACSQNALETPAAEMLPAVKEAILRFRALGAPFVRMTGSGSCVYAAFHSEAEARRAAGAIPGCILTKTAAGDPPPAGA